MKRVIPFVLALSLAILLVGCGGTQSLYNYDMGKYVTVDNYAVTVDSSSDDYLEYLADFEAGFADKLRLEVKSGTVEDGDTVNIDYKGYIDGEAFSGGTAEGYDLVIGSGTFIDGFEEAIIGAEVGTTFDINVTFPDNYGVEELNGQDTTFTVVLNYIVETDKVTEENVEKLGYVSLEEYTAAQREYATINCAWDAVYDNTKVIEYPEKESDIIFDETVSFLTDACKLNNTTLEQFIAYSGLTEDAFNQYIAEYDVKQTVHRDLICYYILESEGYELTEEDLEAGLVFLTAANGLSASEIDYPDGMVEGQAAFIKAEEIILSKATVK